MVGGVNLEKEEDQYVLSIDSGYVSGVSPVDRNYPLSIEDGASRILSPLLDFYDKKKFNKENNLYKDYKPTRW